MINLPGYSIDQQLHEGRHCLVYRGRRKLDRLPVVIKLLKSLYPTLAETLRFQQEYAMLRKLGAYTVVRAYLLDTFNNRPLIVMEDFGGTSLNRCYRFSEIDLAETLDLFIRIAGALEEIHRREVIHKDINPSNILWNRQTGQVKLIDFGISVNAAREISDTRPPGGVEGTMAYIAPEQTGRLNRLIDYRSDLYSLGVTFYELLTGQLPFETEDPMALVHAHLARIPRPPVEISPRIPQALSDITGKLMGKDPDDRYQSAFGLKTDLSACLEQYRRSGEIPVIKIGASDAPDYIQMPKKLYGRQSELAELLGGYDRVSRGGREMLLISGPPGIGKSSLVYKVAGPVAARGGLFISGKFDQYKRDIPYAPLIAAFRKLIEQLLSENPETLSQWRDALVTAFGSSGQVLINVIAELGMIIGDQPPVPELGPVESRNRFHMVFEKFVAVFATSAHPLVLFLDDLQWADGPSLTLLELLLTGQTDHHLLVIAALRNTDNDASRGMIRRLEQVASERVSVRKIALKPLDRADTVRLLAEILRRRDVDVAPLADLCHARTGGNPFFVNQFLMLLRETGAFTFDSRNRNWTWDLPEIEKMQVTDNVVDFLIARIDRLPDKTVAVLKTAACIGNRFDLEMLAHANRIATGTAEASLHPALREGLILPHAGRDVTDGNGIEKRRVVFIFAHDRIQQALYTQLEPAQRRWLHWHIGRTMLAEQAADAVEQNLFEIVNHLNTGADLVTDPAERVGFGELNRRAGEKSMASAAYESAFHYFRTGIGQLPADSWRCHYDLTLRLYTRGAEAACLNSDFANMDFYAEAVLTHAASVEDRIRIYRIRIQSYIARNRLMDAIRTALQALRQVGVRLPLKPGILNVIGGLVATRMRLAGKRDAEFIDRPPMVDPLRIAAMKILLVTSSPAFFANPKLLPLLSFKQIRLTLKYGIARETPMALCVYGLIECGVAGNIAVGYRWGQLALDLMDRAGAREYESRIQLVFNSQIRHWKAHAAKTIEPLIKAYQAGLENGDLEYAAYAAHVHCCNVYCTGGNLAALLRRISFYSAAIRRLNQNTALNYQRIWHQATLNLITGGGRPWQLTGEIYDETKMVPRHLAANDRTALFDVYLHKLILCYMFGSYSEAVENADKAETYADGVTGMLYVPVLCFYAALARAAVCRAMPEGLKKQRLVNRIERLHKKMRGWAAHCPDNFLHKAHLISAELAAIKCDEPAARNGYRQAIEEAVKNDYPNERAIANECFARFWLDRNEPQVARLYLNKAAGQYRMWGAAGKVADLKTRYADLLDDTPDAREHGTTAGQTASTSASGGLDSLTVLKASRAIAGEIRLAGLLKKLMALVMENAGAQSGALLLNRDADFRVEARKTDTLADVSVLEGITIKDADLPESVIRYVERTLEAVVSDDAVHEERYANDACIRRRKPKSLICLPIVHQKSLMGILYAENNLVQGAFTRQHLETLNVIASQAAIALENALLYEDLRRAESKMRNLIRTAKEGFLELDTEARITDVNPEMCAILGWPREALVGKRIVDFVGPDHDDVIRREIVSRREGKAGSYEIGFVRRDQTPVYCLIKGTPLFEKDVFVGSFAMVTDISDRIRAEAQVRKLNEELEARVADRTAELENSLKNLKEAQKQLVESEKMASLGALVAGVAHEVNTPVGVAVTAASFLQEKTEDLVKKHGEPGSPDLARYLRAATDSTTLILSNLKRAADLVKSFKQVAVDQSAEKRRVFNVRQYIDELLMSMQPQFRRTRHTIAVNCETHLEIDGYPGALAQILTNLLINSLVHGFDGIEDGKIEIDVEPAGNGIRITYRDNGKGMDGHVLQHLYDPFFTTRRSHGGTGLGMHVVYNLVTQTLGGTITCESAPGEGVRFRIKLPHQEKQVIGS